MIATRTCRLFVLVAVFAAAALLPVAPAGAKKHKKPSHGTIASPRSGQTLSGVRYVKLRLKAKRGRYTVTVKLGKKVIARRKTTSRRKAKRRVRLDTRKFKNGTYRLKVTITAKSRPRRASQTIRIKVRNPAHSVPMPPPTPAGFTPLLTEDFDKPAPTGSWDPDNAGWLEPVYTGAGGTPWTAYPSSYGDTWNKNPYRAKEVLSVHDGVLDFYLHHVNALNTVNNADVVEDLNAGASVSPILPNGTQYQTYGRYSIRLRVDANLPEYHIAALLWPTPENEADWLHAEADFPEIYLNTGPKVIDGYAHLGPNKDDQESIRTQQLYDMSDWHTYTIEWTPAGDKFYIDSTLVYTTTQYHYDKPMRWQIQLQTAEGAKLTANSGHLLVDWAAVWAWSPGSGGG